MNIFLREMKANRKSLIIWCVCMFFLVLSGIGKFEAISGSGQSVNKIFATMPKAFQELIGTSGYDMSTIIGYFCMLFLFILITAAIHAAMLGADIISKEERDKTSEFLMVKPVSRDMIITAKLFAAFVNIIILNLVTLVSSVVFVNYYAKGKSYTSDILVLMFSLFILQLIFLSIGTGVAALNKNPKTATAVSTAILLITFFISKAVDLNSNLVVLKYITPFKYLEPKIWLLGIGYEPAFVILPILIIAVFISMTYVFYRKRDMNI
jgi:ABC-2 type transport system permease protein